MMSFAIRDVEKQLPNDEEKRKNETNIQKIRQREQKLIYSPLRLLFGLCRLNLPVKFNLNYLRIHE